MQVVNICSCHRCNKDLQDCDASCELLTHFSLTCFYHFSASIKTTFRVNFLLRIEMYREVLKWSE